MSEIPKWPELPKFNPRNFGLAGELYLQARADAAIARLKLAVEALDSLGYGLGCKCGGNVVSVAEALRKIGPIPE
jgi:hypothetical protein